MKHIALLRGINVGGKNKLPMKELTRLFKEAGCQAITSYIQSGNVVFDPGDRELKKIASRVQVGIRVEFGFDAPVVLRSAEELRKAIENRPFGVESAGEEDPVHLVFLADTPDPAALAALDPDRSPGDRFIAPGGAEIYLHLPNGVAKSRLTNNWFDSKLRTTSTIRNWRTVVKLAELASSD